MLSTPDSEARLKLATEIFLKQASISEVTKKIATAVDESLSKQQKEFFLRQQLAAIQRELSTLQRSSTGEGGAGGGTLSELDDDEQHEADDMADLKRKIEGMAHGSEERKMGVREWRRLKRIPQGSVEHGVVRSYVRAFRTFLSFPDVQQQLEWLTSIPWPNSTFIPPTSRPLIRDRAFLTNARSQLDADHFGLDKIKRRLIEYLAVVRLKELVADKEHNGEQDKLAAKAVDQVASEGKADVSANKNQQVILHHDHHHQQQPPVRPQSRKLVKGPILLYVSLPGPSVLLMV